jgi:hypothetical protein
MFISVHYAVLEANVYANRGTPKGEEIVHFLPIIVNRIKPIHNEVPSVRTIQSGLQQLVDALIFHYADFQISPHESKRIGATVNELLVQGKLTKDPIQEKYWVGVVMVRKLATAIFEDSLTYGALNWDVTIYKALVVVIVAALASRAGDVTKDALDN